VKFRIDRLANPYSFGDSGHSGLRGIVRRIPDMRLTIRAGTRADMPRIAELIAGDPGAEAVGILGGRRAARRFGLGLYGIPPGKDAWKGCAVAERDGCIVGVVQSGAQETLTFSPALAWLAIRTLGPLGIRRALSGMRVRDRVHVSPPPGALHITELNVDAACRGQGIGSALLDHTEIQARELGYKQMSLSATTANPARRLYERHGFRVAETKTDPRYEKMTGARGRVLMVKGLD
jgi:ribosomal protein S18 acetylase RimI-like enzyme